MAHRFIQTRMEIARPNYRDAASALGVSALATALKAGTWAVAISAALFTTTIPAQAQPGAIRASFACAKASTAPERMICGDAELARLDRIMADLFTETRSLLLNSEQMAVADKAQRAWLTGRNRCGDAQCVRRAYLNRVTELARELPSDS